MSTMTVNSNNSSKGILHWLDTNIERVLLMVTLVITILLMSYQTLGRYILVDVMGLNLNLAWTEETSRFLFVWMTYLAIPISIRNRNMIRVTALVDQFSKRWQDALWVMADVLFFILGGSIFYYGVRHINMLMTFPQTTAVLGIQYSIVYMILPIGFGLILLRLGQDLYRMINESGVRPFIEGAVIAAVVMVPSLLGLDLPAAAWLFGYFVVFVALGVPVAICLGLSAFVTMYAAATLPVNYVATQSFTAVDNVTLLAIPFFIAAGTFMGEGGLSERLLKLADNLLGRLHGGFGMATVLTCMLFAAMSGSGPATVAAIGSLTIPAMVARGYDKHFAAALVAAAGSIGVMIPPSNPFVVYGVSSNSSIGDLFMAGIVPGIMVGIVLMLYTFYLAKKNDWHGDKLENPGKEIAASFWDAKWALLVPVIILGGIYSGLMTPTESAAVAALYGLLVGIFLYKGLNRENLGNCLVDSADTSATVILLMAMATIFGNILTLENIPATIATFILGISSSKILILLIINILLLIVGMFMETLAAIVILTPIFLPIVTQLGVDPVHFGVIMVVNLAIGFITPPVGVNLFVASGIANLKLENIAKAAMPMLALMILALLLLTYIPDICLWLPNMAN